MTAHAMLVSLSWKRNVATNLIKPVLIAKLITVIQILRPFSPPLSRWGLLLARSCKVLSMANLRPLWMDREPL